MKDATRSRLVAAVRALFADAEMAPVLAAALAQVPPEVASFLQQATQ